MHTQQFKLDYQPPTPGSYDFANLKYNAAQSALSVDPQATQYDNFAQKTVISDPSTYYSGHPAVDIRQQLPSLPSTPAQPLSANSRDHSAAAQHSLQGCVSGQYTYSTPTPPQQGGRSEAVQNGRSLASNLNPMNRGWPSASAPLSMSNTFTPGQDSREHSGSPPYSSRPANEEIILPMEGIQPLGTLEYIDDSGNSTGTTVEAKISAQIHKNFFMGEKHFTCYRRNYMACNCSYTLTPYFPGVPLQFTHTQTGERFPLIGFAMCITACVSQNPHQEVIIHKHTPKRDKGPVHQPMKQPLGPKIKNNQATPPHMGFQDGDQSSRSGYSDIYGMSKESTSLATEYSFERLQFKTATANNGERRAGQQCYQLVVELWGELVSTDPNRRWVKVAVRRSCEIVVRGRSPGHYQRERNKSSTGSGGGGGQSPHGNYGGGVGGGVGVGGGGGNTALSDYSAGAMMSGQQHHHHHHHHQQPPNGYVQQGGPHYDHRGGGAASMYTSNGPFRRDMAPYSLEPKFQDNARFFPSAFTTPPSVSVYGDAGLYNQAQATAASPLGVLPRPERMGLDRCNDGSAAGSSPSLLPPLPVPSMVNSGGYIP